MATAGPVVQALRRAGLRDVDDSALARAMFAGDASLYRVEPQAVAAPRDVDEVLAAVGACRELGVPLTTRGAGTSIAGNAVGPGLVLDLARHLHAPPVIDPQARTATVQPGVVQADLQRAAAPYGLRFGPDPSTADRCTVGGMIGNNACGSRSLGTGRTADNVLGLDVVTGGGERLRLGPGERPGSATLDGLAALVGEHLATIRTGFGRFPRQVSGYALEHLLPERGFDVARALVGSEGTLAVVLGATVRLLPEPAHRLLVVLGYPDMAAAADAVPALLPYGPDACEGIDDRILDVVRSRRGAATVPPLPRGSGWLLVELSGDDPADLDVRAGDVVRAGEPLDSLVVREVSAAAALWQIRADGAGLASRPPGGTAAHAGWEDAAVPPAALGAYLREFEDLLDQHGLAGVPYGHFGEGCVHVRIDFPLRRRGGSAVFHAFLEDAARLVVRHGGSLSGEHGDGRARSGLLELMYPPEALALFGRVKSLFDPDDLLNPGVLVRPAAPDADLRLPQAPKVRTNLGFAYSDDGGDVSEAVHRCIGVGSCLTDRTAAGGVMCPSYLATGREQDSTRGRARVLQEMLQGSTVAGGWSAPEVHEALDLCLACKGCASDCPTGVDMATYKAEVLHQTYRFRPRPRAHYSLGWLPRWARLGARAPGLANALVRAPGLRALLPRAAGTDPRRPVPRLAARTFGSWFAQRAEEDRGVARHGPVLLWVDTFTEHFAPETGVAAVAVLERAGYEVRLPDRRLCCGLTYVTTGQLGTARRVLRRTLSALAAAAADGVPVVGLEPSCTATLRSDARELVLGGDVETVAASVRTLAELLTSTPGWEPPRLDGVPVVAQPHCHHHAVLGWDTDARLLAAAGAEVTRVGGCCGLAGSFGAETGHFDVSVAVAEQALLPAVRASPDDAVVLADGFSCRTQLADLAGVRGQHLAQLLAGGGEGLRRRRRAR